ncbi:hypothetical protein H2199_005287 [Coniosporium tulheliwenetii]|uniref:Uncharacterized protein n=1 Tax=Coniosporium tulheliwenetii TaxID=3383036 RepID=A0ACC2Z3U6_9PEZI|nr:hypothetical protein H2199_005287 [Cladosporium sp. JES 115]
MDCWRGDVLFSESLSVKDIHLSTTHPSTLLQEYSKVSLQFLSLVDTARIPLYIAAGPPLDVWTNTPETEAWFSSALLEQPLDTNPDEGVAREHQPWWQEARLQSPVGILAQFTSNVGSDAARPRITEILFYGTVKAPSNDRSAPWPPVSLPDTNSKDVLASPPFDNHTPQLRIQALPLSSDFLYISPTSVTPPFSPRNPATIIGSEDAQFLPPLFPAASASPSRAAKRKSVSDVFDEATERRRRAKRHGGESVAAAASRADGAIPSLHRRSLSLNKQNGSIDPLPMTTASPRPLSRSPSIPLEPRPASRKGQGLLDGPSKRSSLPRVTSIANLEGDSTIETRNREIISRLVMAGMRMHGFQHRKKQDKSGDQSAEDEEYKLVYHQAFKGVVFAFRRQIGTVQLQLQQDGLRDMVEKLLEVFCEDPLAVNGRYAGDAEAMWPAAVTGREGEETKGG